MSKSRGKTPSALSSAPSNPPSVLPDLSLEDMVKHIYLTVNDIKATLSDQQQRVSKLETEVSSLNKEVSSLKDVVNMHEQSLRSNSIRITGFPFTEDEKKSRNSAALKARILDRVLNPILTVAQERGLIDPSLPVNNIISSCYRVGSASAKPDTASPPPLVVKLSSSQLRVDILRCKKEAVFGPTSQEKAIGLKKFIITEDLTQPAFKKLKELQSSEKVDRAWSIDGRINFMLSNSTVVHRVVSVFDEVDTILEKVTH